MKSIRTGIAILLITTVFTACGSGDTGEGYHSNTDTAAMNTSSGPTDSVTSAIAGSADSTTQTAPGNAGGDTMNKDTNPTNINSNKGRKTPGSK